MCPWHLNQFLCCSPHEQSSHWHSPHEQSSHIGRSALMGVSWSPLSVGGTVLPMLMSSITENLPQAFCHTGLLESAHLVSPISIWTEFSFYGHPHSYIAAQSLWWQHRQSHVGQSAAWRMSYIFMLFSAREINFCMTSNVGQWVADLCQLMEVQVGKLTSAYS